MGTVKQGSPRSTYESAVGGGASISFTRLRSRVQVPQRPRFCPVQGVVSAVRGPTLVLGAAEDGAADRDDDLGDVDPVASNSDTTTPEVSRRPCTRSSFVAPAALSPCHHVRRPEIGLLAQRRRGNRAAQPPVGTAPTMSSTLTPKPGSDPTNPASPNAKIPPSEPMSQ